MCVVHMFVCALFYSRSEICVWGGGYQGFSDALSVLSFDCSL